MDFLGIPWWGWLAVSAILALWRPEPQTMANLRILGSVIALLITLVWALSPVLVFGVVTYLQDWQTGAICGGAWLLLIGFAGLVNSFVDAATRLVDCVLRGPDSPR